MTKPISAWRRFPGSHHMLMSPTSSSEFRSTVASRRPSLRSSIAVYGWIRSSSATTAVRDIGSQSRKRATSAWLCMAARASRSSATNGRRRRRSVRIGNVGRSIGRDGSCSGGWLGTSPPKAGTATHLLLADGLHNGPENECGRGDSLGECGGRGERIRTFDLLNPIQVRYQTALRPDRRNASLPHAELGLRLARRPPSNR